MKPQRWSGLFPLASLILLLHWTNISARSLDDTSEAQSLQRRTQIEMPDSTREKVQASTEVVKSTLTVIKEVIDNIPVDKVTDVMKSFSKIASLAPGIGTLAASVLNMALAFVSQENSVLNEVKERFAEVNRKLDSLSIQITNLETDVEWFNYASVYSRDEVTILNAWEKFNDLRQNRNLVKSAAERLRLAEIFASYYENSGAESSVYNLYRYLTVESVSLHENLNNLLKRKLKCDINKIGRYNLYFSSLLWKGMLLNQFYWKLIGFNTDSKEVKHVQMFMNVSEAQLAAIDYCLLNYARYMKKDVEEIAKGHSADDTTAVALKVKKVLDKKYNWYKWVVVVYSKANKDNHLVFGATEVDAGSVIVLVSYTLHGAQIDVPYVKETADTCFSNKYCRSIRTDLCQESHLIKAWGAESDPVHIVFNEYAVVSHVTYYEDYAELPAPLHRVGCSWSTRGGRISIHFSRKLPVCPENLCQNNGDCERVLESNEWFCRCPTGFYGEHCEQRIDTRAAPKEDAIFPPIKSIQDRVKNLEHKLTEIMKRCHIY